MTNPGAQAMLDELKLLIDEYDTHNSDWGFRKRVIISLVEKIRASAVQGEPVTVADAWRELVEKDDRSSSDEYPDMALITREELANFMSRAVQGEPVAWRFYRDGVIVPITEEEARHTFDRWNVLSDDRGAATFMIEQMWAEIDRLRAHPAIGTPR